MYQSIHSQSNANQSTNPSFQNYHHPHHQFGPHLQHQPIQPHSNQINPGYLNIKMEEPDEDQPPNSPDSDPNAGQYSSPLSDQGGNKNTKCAVCLELTDNRHLHYGALCCFSCRAFFRRANQSAKKTIYICKQGNACDITYKNRKKCQKCR